MKVIQINACHHRSSTGRTMEEMHKYLSAHGIESWVFYTDKLAPEFCDSHSVRLGNFLSNKFHALLGRITGLYGYASWCTTLRLLRYLRRIKPDVVILRNIHSNFINLPMLTSYLAKHDIPTVWVLHDCWLFTGGCTHYTYNRCYKWQTQCHDCKFRDDVWLCNNARKVHSDRKRIFSRIPHLYVVGVSDWVANEARKSFLGETATILRHYNWVNTQVFYPRDRHAVRQRLGFSDDDFIILSVSQGWGRMKGLNLFIQMAEHYSDAKIVLVGTINEAYPDNVIHYDATDDTNLLAEYYSMADVLVNLSQQETFSKVNIEAIACGTPVICNNNTAMPEIVGDAGCSFPNNDMDSCYAAIDELKEKHHPQGQSSHLTSHTPHLTPCNSLEELHKRCLSRVNANFIKDKILTDWLNFLQTIVKK